MTDLAELPGTLEADAQQQGFLVWHGWPYDAPSIDWRELSDIAGFLETGRLLGASILYLDARTVDSGKTAAVVAGWAINGILHKISVVDERLVETLETDDYDWEAQDDLLSWGRPRYNQLPDHLRQIVDSVVEDVRFDPYGRGDSIDVLSDHAGQVSPEDYAAIQEAARDRFAELHGQRLRAQADQLAPSVVDHPDFDPLASFEEQQRFVRAHVAAEDPRVVSRVSQAVPQLVYSRGLRERAEAELNQLADQIVDDLPVGTRDKIGFANRNRVREEALRPYLSAHSERIRRHLPRVLTRLEAERYGPDREARYATAARALIEQLGETKAATSRTLGLSTSVLDRLMREHQNDVTLPSDDPILDIAPELRRLF